MWTVIALLQRSDPNIISVVYSGDGDAGKEEIISKVKVCVEVVLERAQLMLMVHSLGSASHLSHPPSILSF